MLKHGASLNRKTGKLAAATDKSSIRLKVEVDKDEYKLGEAVKVKMALMNVTKNTARLTFPTSQIFDFSVEGVDNEFSYVWSSDKVFLQVIVKKELKPGESIQQNLEWMPNNPGTYALRGYTTGFMLDDETMLLEAKPIMLKVYGR